MSEHDAHDARRPRSLFHPSSVRHGPSSVAPDEASGDGASAAAASEASAPRPRFLSEADCQDIIRRLARFARGGGHTTVEIASLWRGNVRWARNQINTSGEVSENWVRVTRTINNAAGVKEFNDTTDTALVAALRQTERQILRAPDGQNTDDLTVRLPLEPPEPMPSLFSEATYQLDAGQRAAIVHGLTKSAADKGMLSAGYIEVQAHSNAILSTMGRSVYFPYTQAQVTMTVRDPSGSGSGWAGGEHFDWAKVDGAKLAAVALDKCLKSQNPVRVEPGRFTVIMEPQAVCDFLGSLISAPTEWFNDTMDLASSTPRNHKGIGPFNKSVSDPSPTYLGQRVMDERITMHADPKDPELGTPPFNLLTGPLPDLFRVDVYHPVTWVDRGVLSYLAYDRKTAIEALHKNTGLPNTGSFRMSGGTTSLEEMIATTKRGLLVTRFDRLYERHFTSQLFRGFTRDGLWLIENGKISKAVKNLVVVESILFALNNVEQIGVPQRVFHPGNDGLLGFPKPVVVPPIKIRDFSFTALTDAV